MPGLGGHPAQVVVARYLGREVDRERAGLLGQHLGGLRVQSPAPAAREPGVHGAGHQDVHEPQGRGPSRDISQQSGGLGRVEGVQRIARGDTGHVNHRVHRELRAEDGGRREHLDDLAPEGADAAPEEIAQVRGDLVARRGVGEVDLGRSEGKAP